ncbi:nuclear transport factor 2 family protein [Novosphingobium lindaniclasticum]|uniref:SnoaL-like domain-containing protein n=1 Tax=Novosphingobium lindaniclasticum LE124 TaxID=1096930 RepID=T0IP32_9SPHN|nr:nuclear transport factor 2 family protein [Novosphingobium lindaniclasticum]EQB13595.1 hypothetical protein L284_14045 [Novosphingobium lindaniclasticum LE124]
MPISLEEVAARLATLEDKEAIRSLKARYLRACDLKQPEVVRDCFIPTARIAYDGFPEFGDRDAFIEVFRQMACQPGVYDIHHATNWEIDLVGPDEARGLWSLNFRTILMNARHVSRLAVEYEDVYRRQAGQWFIAETVSRITSLITEEIAEDGALRVVAYGEAPEFA